MMTWMIASVLFIILLLMVITALVCGVVFIADDRDNAQHRTYKAQQQLNSIICQLSHRGIEVTHIWSDTVQLKKEDDDAED